MVDKQLLIISRFNDTARPTGGVTMHVHRLLKLLIEPQVSNYELCDYKKEGWHEQIGKIKRAAVMHLHASNALLKLSYVLLGKLFKTKTLLTLHGKYGVYSPFMNVVHRLALKWCDVPILINKESYDEVKKFNKRAVYIPAFLPPIAEEEVLSSEIEKKILSIKNDGKPLVVTNASRRAFTDDGKEIYGIEFLVNYFKLHNEYNLVVLDPQNEYASLIAELPSNIIIISGLHSFCGLVKISDIVIRNTPTDGDSFSVKEALYLHKPVVATDAVSRPKGAILFKYNDANSLDNAISKALNIKDAATFTEESAINRYYQLYREVGVIQV